MQPDPLAQLTEIRAIMERSSRFLSLSGLSGVGAGVIALLGAAAAHFYLLGHYPGGYDGSTGGFRYLLTSTPAERRAALPFLVLLAAGVAGAAVLVAWYFTRRRMRQQGQHQPLWNGLTRRLAVALALPLGAGAVFCLRLYLGPDPGLVVPGLLVFYGLALLNASKYTFDEIRWLGLTQVGLALLALGRPGWGVLFFALGFGLGHIGYGLLMYNRYERPAPAGGPATSVLGR